MVPKFGIDYIADFLDLFGRVIEQDGKLYCSNKCIGRFVRKHDTLVELVTGVRMIIDWNEDDVIPNRDRLQEFKGVFSPAMVCYERIMQLS